MRSHYALDRLPPHVIDQINRRERDRRREEESRRLPLELPQGPPPGWIRNPSGEWIRDEEDREREDSDAFVIQM